MNSRLKVQYIRVPVENVDRALDWYIHMLGAVTPHKAHDGLASCSLAGGPALHLVRIDDEKRLAWMENGRKEPVVGLLTGRIRQTRDHMLESGVAVGELIDEGDIGDFFHFYDLDGNLFEVYGPRTAEQYEWDWKHGNVEERKGE